MTYRLNAAARLELHKVIGSFARDNRSRAIRFVDDLTISISLLESNPRMGPQLTHGTRRLLLRQFSYVLLYRIDEDDCINYSGSQSSAPPPRLLAKPHPGRAGDLRRSRLMSGRVE